MHRVSTEERMKFVREILGRIFALWAMLWFIITMLIIFVPVWAAKFWPEPKRTGIFIKISRIWMAVFFFVSGVRRIFKGREHFKKGENYVVVCNHNSFMDVPLTSPGIPGINKTIAKIEISRVPIFGVMYKRGSILVDRKSPESRKASFTKMKEVLEMGMHMCIYPEGTRNKSSEPLQRFHDGAFKLAVATGKPIMPAVIFYTKKVLHPDKKFFFWPHHVEMHFLEPVPVDSSSVAEKLREEVFGVMREYFIRNNRP